MRRLIKDNVLAGRRKTETRIGLRSSDFQLQTLQHKTENRSNIIDSDQK